MTKEMTFGHSLFTDSMLQTSWSQRSRRGWSTLTSFGLQAMIMGLLLLLPLLRSVTLPSAARTVSTPISVGVHSAEPAPRVGSPRAVPTPVSPDAAIFVAPGRIPTTISTGPDDSPAAPMGNIGNGPIGVGIGAPTGFPLPITGNWVVPVPPPASGPVRQFRPSSLLEGSLIHRVQPVYPYPAKMAHVQGAVVLSAIINKAGSIENLQVLSGHPLLVGAAVDAVRQWRYRPYILNTEPIEVETQITVKFTLSEN